MVAKVDRLTRSVAFLSRLLEAGVDVRFADLPALEGPTVRFMAGRADHGAITYDMTTNDCAS